MNGSANGTAPSPDAVCLLPLTHLIALIPINILSITIGTIGNTLVIATVYTNISLQIISNFWLASMAIADLLVTALGQPLLVAFWALQVNRECNEPVSETFRLIANMSCSASVLHLCFISIDRCLVIVRPLEYKKIRTMRRFKIAVAIAWTVPIIYGVLRMTINRKVTSYFTVIAAALCYLAIISCHTDHHKSLEPESRNSTFIINIRSRQTPDRASRDSHNSHRCSGFHNQLGSFNVPSFCVCLE